MSKTRRERGCAALNRKRTAKEWMEGENIVVLQGMAMLSRSMPELARRMGESVTTVAAWRRDHELIREATELGRYDADAWVIADTFRAIKAGDKQAATRWWRFRIAAKPPRSEDEQERRPRVVIADPARARGEK
jgi:hypothetical protein